MKKVLLFIIALLLLLNLCSCSVQTKKKAELTEDDMVYVDTVYSLIDDWDVKIRNSNQDWTIDKVAFYDYDGTNKICFYTLYPVTDVYGRGFYVSSDGMKQIKFGVYETDEQTRSWGWVARTRGSGYDWNSNASKEQKYEMLKEAYLYFKEHNIYK